MPCDDLVDVICLDDLCAVRCATNTASGTQLNLSREMHETILFRFGYIRKTTAANEEETESITTHELIKSLAL